MFLSLYSDKDHLDIHETRNFKNTFCAKLRCSLRCRVSDFSGKYSHLCKIFSLADLRAQLGVL